MLFVLNTVVNAQLMGLQGAIKMLNLRIKALLRYVDASMKGTKFFHLPLLFQVSFLSTTKYCVKSAVCVICYQPWTLLSSKRNL